MTNGIAGWVKAILRLEADVLIRWWLMVHKITDQGNTVSAFLFLSTIHLGIKAMAEAVRLIALGTAPCIPQPEEGASYDPIWKKKEVGQIPWDKMKTAQQLHNFIRGNDKVPGAWTSIDGVEVCFITSYCLRGMIECTLEIQ